MENACPFFDGMDGMDCTDIRGTYTYNTRRVPRMGIRVGNTDTGCGGSVPWYVSRGERAWVMVRMFIVILLFCIIGMFLLSSDTGVCVYEMFHFEEVSDTCIRKLRWKSNCICILRMIICTTGADAAIKIIDWVAVTILKTLKTEETKPRSLLNIHW